MLEQGANAEVEPPTKAALTLIEKLTLWPDELSAEDIHSARATGLTDVAIEHVMYIATLWNIFGRLADAFGFHVYTDEQFLKGAPIVQKFGYRYPAVLWPRMWPRT